MNIKYLNRIIQLWLFKAALFICVFSFSGLNSQAQSTLSQSFKTELVEARDRKKVYQLKRLFKKYAKSLLSNPSLTSKSFNIWTLLNYNKVVNAKFKIYQRKVFYLYNILIKLFLKTPSFYSEDDATSRFIG